MKQYLTINDLSILLNLKPSWIRSQIFQHKIPYIKLGHHIRFKLSEIDLWIKEQSKGPSPPNNIIKK